MISVGATTMDMIEPAASTMMEVMIVIAVPSIMPVRIPEEAVVAPIAVVKRPVIAIIVAVVIVGTAAIWSAVIRAGGQ
jgi:hypothetical protein